MKTETELETKHKANMAALAAIEASPEPEVLTVPEAQQAVQNSLVGKLNTKRGNRRISRKGPLTMTEVSDRMHDAQALAESFTSAEFAAGIVELVKADVQNDVSQKVLGEFIVKYERSVPEVQAAIRLALAGERVIPSRECFKDKANAVDQLAEVLFTDNPELFELASNRQVLCIKRIDNWKRAYKPVQEAATQAASNEVRDLKARHGLIDAVQALENAEKYGITPAKVDIPTAIKAAKKTGVKRPSAPEVLATIYMLFGQITNSIDKATEYRTALYNGALAAGVDHAKLAEAISKKMDGAFIDTLRASETPVEAQTK